MALKQRAEETSSFDVNRMAELASEYTAIKKLAEAYSSSEEEAARIANQKMEERNKFDIEEFFEGGGTVLSPPTGCSQDMLHRIIG